MKYPPPPSVSANARLREAPEEIPAEEGKSGTSMSAFIRLAVHHHRGKADFYARGETAWQEYLSTGISHPVDKVGERVRSRIAARRLELQSHGK